MTDKRFLKNTAILFAAMAVTKIVGALFKIPLANLLGGTGMGYFSAAYGLYSPIFALTAAGIPTVLMRTTARCIAVGNQCKAAVVRKYALIMFSITGAVGSACIIAFAKPFAEHIACSPKSETALICIAPAVVFCSTACVLRGYREGMSDVMPSAAASVTEAISRAVFGLGLSYAVIFHSKTLFLNGKPVFGEKCATLEQAYSAALPYAAAGAVLAVSISELVGLVTLIITEKHNNCKAFKAPVSESRCEICFNLIKDIIPIAASALAMNCVSFVDLLTVTRTLSISAAENPEYYLQNFKDCLDACGGIENLPNFMYGSYTGIALSLFMIIPSFAGMTEKTAAPEIAAAWERRDNKTIINKIRLQLKAGALIACPACFGAAALAMPIMKVLYRARPAEVSVCVSAFVILCLGGLLTVICSALFGIFQAIGKAHIPLILMIASILIKLLLNPLLISNPNLNVSGAALSSVIGYAFSAVTGSLILKSLIDDLNIFSAVFQPFVGGVLCGLSAYAVRKLIENRLGNLLCVLFSVITGALVYFLFLGVLHIKNRASSPPSAAKPNN